MNIIDAIKNVDRSVSNSVVTTTLDEFLSRFGGMVGHQHSHPISGHYLKRWLCRGSIVGAVVYYKDGKPMAIVDDMLPKGVDPISFTSTESAKELCDLLQSRVPKSIKLIDPTLDIGHSYSVHRGDMLLTPHGFYRGSPTTVVKSWHDYEDVQKRTRVDVLTLDGHRQTIQCEDLRIPYHLAHSVH